MRADYLSNTHNPLARMAGNVLISVGLLSPDGPAPKKPVTTGLLLKEALHTAPSILWLFQTDVPFAMRLMVLRQYGAIAALMFAMWACGLFGYSGLLLLSMGMLQYCDPVYFDFRTGTDHLALMIAAGIFFISAKTAALCLALATLFRPMRARSYHGEKQEA